MSTIQPERPLYWSDVIYDIQDVLQGTPDVHLVGGIVRDVYRDYPFKDIDLVCAGDGGPIARKIADALGGAFYPLDKERGVGRAILNGPGGRLIVDVAAMRGGDLLTDLQDRDFTVNAMSVALDGDLNEIYDPLGGVRDWRERILRRCSEASIANDPIRALRAVRLSLQLGLKIEPQTRDDLRTYGPDLVNASPERVRDEFFALLGSSKAQGGLTVLRALGLLELIVPETAEIPGEAWRDTLLFIEKLTVLLTVISPRRDDNVAANAEFGTFVYLLDRFRGWLQSHLTREFPNDRNYRALLVFAVLMSQTSANAARTATERATALKLSNDEIQIIERALTYFAWPMEIHEAGSPEPRTVYRFWREAGDAGIDACQLTLAGYLTARGFELDTPAWTALLQSILALFEGYETASNVTLLVTGSDVMDALKLAPGPQIGQVLEALREAQALGEISTIDEALDFAAEWVEQRP